VGSNLPERLESFFKRANQAHLVFVEADMDLKLAGKVALVTGSTAGIGFAIARSLAIEGAHVCLNGRTQARVDAAIAEIRRQHKSVKIDGIAADFSSLAGAEKLGAKLPAERERSEKDRDTIPKPSA
jgi:NAD(P)-dependent dehydrogenase (short-subunit alcohol dehydrogenase family)